MNKEILKGKWQQLEGEVKKKWGKLTNDDIAVIKGSYEQLLGKIRERYGYEKEEAEKELREFWKEHVL